MIPESISIFGSGLGSDANGRPGEMAIRAMWIEGGVFWSTIKITLFLSMLFFFIRKSINLIIAKNLIAAYAVTCFSISWLLGILSGLSSNLELAQAILFIPIIAILMIDKNTESDPKQDIARQ